MKHTNFDDHPDGAPRFRACSAHALRRQRRVFVVLRAHPLNARSAPSPVLPSTRLDHRVTRTQFYENSLLRILESVN